MNLLGLEDELPNNNATSPVLYFTYKRTFGSNKHLKLVLLPNHVSI